MMKTYHLYVFTQDGCPPCDRLKNYVKVLSKDEQAELDFVPLKTSTGSRTALAEELSVELTPTLVVCHEHLQCELDEDGEEFCDGVEESVERFVGANDIIEHLGATLDAYTYAHSE
jgi:thioredoxin-related protein